jgi:hypothetical protein
MGPCRCALARNGFTKSWNRGGCYGQRDRRRRGVSGTAQRWQRRAQVEAAVIVANLRRDSCSKRLAFDLPDH